MTAVPNHPGRLAGASWTSVFSRKFRYFRPHCTRLLRWLPRMRRDWEQWDTLEIDRQERFLIQAGGTGRRRPGRLDPDSMAEQARLGTSHSRPQSRQRCAQNSDADIRSILQSARTPSRTSMWTTWAPWWLSLNDVEALLTPTPLLTSVAFWKCRVTKSPLLGQH